MYGTHTPTLSITLTYVGSDHRCSTYRAADGTDVYLRHGDRLRLVNLDDLNLEQMWKDFKAGLYAYDLRDFLESEVAPLLIDEDVIEEIYLCMCGYPAHRDHLTSTGDSDLVCEECLSDDYVACASCSLYFHGDYTTSTLTEEEVCTPCRNRYWSFCSYCDGWRNDNDSSHDHIDGCGCEAPRQMFSIRSGQDNTRLSNDDRLTVTLPAGVITSEGFGTIARHIRASNPIVTSEDYRDTEKVSTQSVSYRLEELGDKWQTKEGNFTKRLSRFAYKEFKLKLSPDLISEVGNIARDHSREVDFNVEITRDLNRPAEDFAHAGSCWWTEYEESRCALKSNGGFGLRSFSPTTGRVNGRAWVMPLRLVAGRMVPTFDTLTCDAFVVFNGYGTFDGYVPARIVAHLAGWTYRKIEFTCSPMYVNSSAGYIVAREEIASNFTDGEIALEVSTHSNLYATEGVTLGA